MKRPKQPYFTDHNNLESYYNLNRYYNDAEKIFDKWEPIIERLLTKYEELKTEYSSMNGTDIGFSKPPIELELLEKILRV